MTEVALGGVFTAGLLTFLSPCVLPVVPLYLALLAGPHEEDLPPSRLRPFLSTVLFAIGFTLVFALIGLSATVVGRFLIANKLFFQQLGGVLVLLLGLRFMGWLRVPGLDGGGGDGAYERLKTRFHYVNALLLGIVFAFAWSPCIGSVLGAVLTYTSLATTSPIEGMGYLATYGAGFALPLLVVAAFAGPALAWLRRARRFIPTFEKVTGVLMVVTGFLLATDRLGLLDSAFTKSPEPPVRIAAARPSPGTPAVPPAAKGAPAVGATCDESDPTAACTAPATSKATPTMYEFFSPSCTICRQMIPIVSALRSGCAGKDARIELVDVTSGAGKELARKQGVGGIPVFLFEDAAGKEVARLVGYQTYGALQQSMSVLIGEQCRGYRAVPDLK